MSSTPFKSHFCRTKDSLVEDSTIALICTVVLSSVQLLHMDTYVCCVRVHKRQGENVQLKLMCNNKEYAVQTRAVREICRTCAQSDVFFSFVLDHR